MISRFASSRVLKLDPSGSVFAEFTQLAIKNNSSNLGQGFPSLPVKKFILDALNKTSSSNGMVHQYSRSMGHLPLTKSLANFYADKLPQKLDPTTDVLITVGASEAIYSSIQTFIGPGDEVIVMQPFYDSYVAGIKLAGGTPVYVNLKPGEWTLDIQDLKKAVTPATKMIILNNPHNPTGRLFSRETLQGIADVAKENDLLVLSDEVYESLVFSGEMIKFASLPGMFERTITIGSIGKMFGVTGWKVGWVLSSPELVKSISLVHQYVPFCVCTVMQEAIAVALDDAMQTNYFEETRKQYQGLRDLLFQKLQTAGLKPTLPDAGYFIMASIDHIEKDLPSTDPRGRDYDVAKYWTENAQVTAIPPSAFYEVDKEYGYMRFAFCKQEKDIMEAGDKLLKFFKA